MPVIAWPALGLTGIIGKTMKAAYFPDGERTMGGRQRPQDSNFISYDGRPNQAPPKGTVEQGAARPGSRATRLFSESSPPLGTREAMARDPRKYMTTP